MNYRRLGKWGVKVSEVALGSWLTYGGAVEEQAAISQIDFALENGINFLDTANVYARGQAEVVVGKALKNHKRDSIVLASKVYFPMGDGPNDKGLSRKHIFEQCHHSLKRLGTDYIDLYQCHRYDEEVPMFEIVRAMDDLIRQGKILYWGVSEWNAEQIEEAVQLSESINASPPVSNQPCYNMLERKIEKHVVPMCRKLGLGQVVFSPLAQGVLTGKYKPGKPAPEGSRLANDNTNMFMISKNFIADETLRRVEAVSAVAKELGLTMAQLSLAWCLRTPDVSSVICGATKTSQIEDNIKAANVTIAESALVEIDAILAGEAVR